MHNPKSDRVPGPGKYITVHVPAIQESDLVRLEDRLRIRLPEHYRRFMLNYPVKLMETRTDLGWSHVPLSERQFRFNIDELIYFNEDVRKPGTPWTPDDGPWPERYFVIGDDQCGNHWVIDITSPDQDVLLYDHETGEFNVVETTVEGFAESLVRETQEWNQEQRLRRDNE